MWLAWPWSVVFENALTLVLLTNLLGLQENVARINEIFNSRPRLLYVVMWHATWLPC